MVVNHNIRPTSILAISFTKASSTEMKNRAISLSQDPRIHKVTYGTFHSVFFRILRHFEKYNLDSILDEKSKRLARAISLSQDPRIHKVTYGTFHSVFFRILRHFEKYNLDSILDEKSKRLAIKGILKSLNVENGEDDEVGQLINEISFVKNELMDKGDFNSEVVSKDEFIKAYNLYEEHKHQIKKIDFDDMLLRTYYLLKNNSKALETVRSVYRYILVDEFQDINKVQFEVLKLISNPQNNIFVVGDEDQSIYGFRGARPDFLLEFEEYFSGTKKVMLDINYRSKGEIIDVANRLIEKNSNRYEKVIKCSQGNGGNISYIAPKDSEEEAVLIGKEILEEIKKDFVEYSDFAVIYRTNIQSRALVDVFMDMRIPFVVKDSIVTIYDHWAAQDILAYLRLGLDSSLSKDWVRIINKPFRYISRDSINSIKDEKDFINALITKCNLHPKQVKTINDLDIDLSYLKTLNPQNAISYIRTSLEYDMYILDYCSNRKIKSNGLIEILNELESSATTLNPQNAISYIRTSLEYDMYILDYCSNRKIKSNGLIEILNELESSATNFKTIKEYLDHIDRVKSEVVGNKNKDQGDGVIFTTMHSAKGLEFKNVYIITIKEYLDHIDRVKSEVVGNKNKDQGDGVIFTTMHSAKGLEFKNVYIIGVNEGIDHIDRVKSEVVGNKNKDQGDGVIFTTMHSAKGLEFKNVYIIGVNEGTIPHEKSYDLDDDSKKDEQIEEERRLMYVAITRAEDKLCISSPQNKGTIPHEKSYDLDDDSKKDEQIEEERRLMYVAITRAEDKLCISSPQNKYGRKVSVSTFIDDIKAPTKEEMDSISIGDTIYHKRFKGGTIVAKDGDSIRVKFSDGTRILNYRVCILNNVIHV